MKQKEHYSEALAYLRDYCLRHGRPMHSSFTVRKTGMLMPDELMPIPYDYNI